MEFSGLRSMQGCVFQQHEARSAAPPRPDREEVAEGRGWEQGIQLNAEMAGVCREGACGRWQRAHARARVHNFVNTSTDKF